MGPYPSYMPQVRIVAPSRMHTADCNLRQGARHLEGTYKGNCLRIFLNFSGSYGPIWALMGPYGPGPGP